MNNCVSHECILSGCLVVPEELRKGRKRKKEADKPDTFTEKLVVHLMKNLLVRGVSFPYPQITIPDLVLVQFVS